MTTIMLLKLWPLFPIGVLLAVCCWLLYTPNFQVTNTLFVIIATAMMAIGGWSIVRHLPLLTWSWLSDYYSSLNFPAAFACVLGAATVVKIRRWLGLRARILSAILVGLVMIFGVPTLVSGFREIMREAVNYPGTFIMGGLIITAAVYRIFIQSNEQTEPRWSSRETASHE
jgi:hypothetical protein